MMSCVASPAWGCHFLSHCHTVRGMVVSYLVTLARCKRSVVWHRPVGSPHHCIRDHEWSTGPTLHCVRLPTCLECLNGAACLHVLQCLLGEGTSVMREHALGMRRLDSMPRPAKPFFIPKVR
jgi:hypothetical protein